MIEQDIVARLRRLEVWCAIVALFVLVAIGLTVWGFANSANATSAASREARSAKALAATVVRNRRETILGTCRDQNHRHRATVREVNRLIAQAEKRLTGQQKHQAKTSRKATLLLIDRIEPVQNCRRVLARDT